MRFFDAGEADIEAADGSWLKAPFLVDTAADRTVLSAAILAALQIPPRTAPHALVGVGGVSPSVVVETCSRLPRENSGKALFRGQFAAFTDAEALDMSVLGSDILNLFALIVDRPAD